MIIVECILNEIPFWVFITSNSNFKKTMNGIRLRHPTLIRHFFSCNLKTFSHLFPIFRSLGSSPKMPQTPKCGFVRPTETDKHERFRIEHVIFNAMGFPRTDVDYTPIRTCNSLAPISCSYLTHFLHMSFDSSFPSFSLFFR